MEPIQVVDELARDMEDGLLGSAGGRFLAWVIAGGVEAALAMATSSSLRRQTRCCIDQLKPQAESSHLPE